MSTNLRIARLVLAAAFASPAFSAGAASLNAEIRTTSYGVPHIRAKDFESVGFGIGYSTAKNDICEIAPTWVTVNAQRSLYFGPEAGETRGVTAGAYNNLQSDLFWKRILDSGLVEKELAAPAPLSPTQDVRDIVRGYAAGYNHYLAKTGVDQIPDERCRGAAWVRPITEKDIYLRAVQWNLTVGSGGFVPDLLKPARPDKGTAAAAAQRDLRLAKMDGGRDPGLGSNVIALGRDATDNGRGMLFANPHWYWHGPDRWTEGQLTIPGKMNVYGTILLGTPVVFIGHTEKVAWSHTLSTPKRHTIYELKLVPGDPTAYVYDGAVRKMTPRTVTVDVKEKDGRIGTRSHIFWETHFGPLITNDKYSWTSTTAYAVRDGTYTFRWLNQQIEMNQAQSAEEMEKVGLRHLAIGWLNTVAADSVGNAYYADRSSAPNVTDAKLAACVTSDLGKQVLAAERLPVLDGSRSDCEWGNDPDTPIEGIFGPATLPRLLRSDYTTNSNDSYWTNNLRQLLEGFPRILGDERAPRTLRTRIGLVKIERRLNGTDGLPGKRFTLDQLEAVTMDNRVLTGELWRDDVVTMCRKLPAAQVPPEACDILAKWDLTENLDSPGIVLWRRFFEHLSPEAAFLRNLPPDVFSVPFDPKDPMNTPRGLNTANPRVPESLIKAVADLRGSGVPLDGTYRRYHYDVRNGERIPVHGGYHGLGQYNLIHNAKGWVPGEGWPNIAVGSSYIMWTQFTDDGPKGRSITVYSQSTNPTSPHYADQTKLWAEKKSKPILFREQDILADPNLKTEIIEAMRE